MRQIQSLIALSSVGASLLVATTAGAQTTTGPTIMATAQTAPTRIVNGVTVQPRSQNLTPLGVNYSDCILNMTLQFEIFISGLVNGTNVTVWATRTGNCSQDADRGNGSIATCWQLPGGISNQTLSGVSEPVNIRVQDLVGPQNNIPTPPQAVSYGASACNAQVGQAPVPMTIWFVPVDSNNSIVGTAYSYGISTDLVGPAPPVVATPGIGDTLLLLNWTANTDSDTAGYDVFIDPPPGKPVLNAATLFCPDGAAATSSASTGTTSTSSSASTSATDDAATDDGAADDGAADDGAIDDGASTSSSTTSATSTTSTSSSGSATTPACYYVAGNSEAGGTGCSSSVLSGNSLSEDSGTIDTTVLDDAGNIIDGSVSTTGNSGISLVPCDYLIGTSCPSGQPAYTAQNTSVAGESGTNFTIKGLQNGGFYNIAVAAVDNSGNVGPQSPLVCQAPLPVDDFFKVYREAGGQAGGNFCSLEAVGSGRASSIASVGALGATALAFGRRRRKGR